VNKPTENQYRRRAKTCGDLSIDMIRPNSSDEAAMEYVREHIADIIMKHMYEKDDFSRECASKCAAAVLQSLDPKGIFVSRETMLPTITSLIFIAMNDVPTDEF